MNRATLSFLFLSLRVQLLIGLRAINRAKRVLDLRTQPKSDLGVLYYFVGLAYVRRKKFEFAREVLIKALELAPDFLVIPILLADLRMHFGEFRQAAELYGSVVNLRPDLRTKDKNELSAKYRRALIAAGDPESAARVSDW